MRAADVMTKSPVTIEMDDSLSTVKDMFELSGFHHLLVVEDGKLFGVVSDRDLLRAVSPRIGTVAETVRDTATLNKRVHQIMTRRPVTVRPDATLSEVVRQFNSHRFSVLPVVDDQARPVGIISWRDVFKAIEPHLDAL